MALDKDKVHEIVEIFYQKPPFKTFYVNSTDGVNFCKPLGVFISLGITTSFKVLTDLAKILCRTPGMTARVAEIVSTKVEGQFLNVLSDSIPDTQYEVNPETVAPSKVLGKSEAEAQLQELMDQGKTEQYMKLRDTIARVQEDPAGAWTNKQVMCLDNGGYRVFHRLVNYRKDVDDTEYRLGIYVDEDI